MSETYVAACGQVHYLEGSTCEWLTGTGNLIHREYPPDPEGGP
jgi:hypothetical protein